MNDKDPVLVFSHAMEMKKAKKYNAFLQGLVDCVRHGGNDHNIRAEFIFAVYHSECFEKADEKLIDAFIEAHVTAHKIPKIMKALVRLAKDADERVNAGLIMGLYSEALACENNVLAIRLETKYPFLAPTVESEEEEEYVSQARLLGKMRVGNSPEKGQDIPMTEMKKGPQTK